MSENVYDKKKTEYHIPKNVQKRSRKKHGNLFFKRGQKSCFVPPLSPAPSASICSSVWVAPPVIKDLIRVNAFGLKYV